ncbi:hypothetical protein D3C87_1337320 [compost metagenome]
MAVFDRAVQWVGLAAVSFRFEQDVGDNQCDVAGGERREAAVGVKRRQVAAFTDERRNVEHPLGEKSHPQVGGGNAGPGKDLFRHPVVQCCLTAGVGPRLFVGHVDDVLHALLFRRLSEQRCRFHQAITQRITEVRAIDAFHGRTQGFQIQQVADANFGPQVLQLL